MKEVKKISCKRCQAEFECGGKCWCSSYPPILPMDSNTSCLCPSCMKVEIISYINEYLKELTPDKIQHIQKMGKPKEMIEGVDFTLTSKGYKIMTSWFLLRQGGCCGNGCLNCPY